MITQEKVEKVLTYMAETDEQYASAKARAESIKYRLKVQEAVAFQLSVGSVAERGAAAKTSKEYLDLLHDLDGAVLDRETIGTKRETGKLIIEVWRSEFSARKAVMIT